jgi:hypothetical protein
MLRYVLVAAIVMAGASAHAGTANPVRPKGFVSGGVAVGLGGFSMPHGKGVGLDVDAPRASVAPIIIQVGHGRGPHA